MKETKTGGKPYIIAGYICSVLFPYIGFAFAGYYLFWGGKFDEKTRKSAKIMLGISSLFLIINIVLTQ